MNEFKAIEFAGDNPCAVLYGDRGTVVSAISYWRANASLQGVGEVLFLLQRSSEHNLVVSVFTDNADLARFAITFNQHFEGFQGVSFDVEIQSATFSTCIGSESVELECVSAEKTVQVQWKGLTKPYILRSEIIDFGKQVGRSYEVSSVIISANSASILVNDELQPGRVVDGYGALPKSAFVAFCETWARLA